jgi:hypothetical protein
MGEKYFRKWRALQDLEEGGYDLFDGTDAEKKDNQLVPSRLK